jgi:hypothetical protein
MKGAGQMQNEEHPAENGGQFYDRQTDEQLMDTLDVMDNVQGYAYADPETRSFRLDTQDQVLRSWTLLHDPDIADSYSQDDLMLMRQRVRDAARQFGVSLNEKGRNQ